MTEKTQLIISIFFPKPWFVSSRNTNMVREDTNHGVSVHNKKLAIVVVGLAIKVLCNKLYL